MADVSQGTSLNVAVKIVQSVSRSTLYNIILARKFLETSKNIKIDSHPFYHIICHFIMEKNSPKA